MVVHPGGLFGNQIFFLFEKQDSTRASGYKCFSLEEDHLPQIKFCHSFKSENI